MTVSFELMTGLTCYGCEPVYATNEQLI